MRLWDFGTLGSGGIASLEDRSAVCVAVLAVVVLVALLAVVVLVAV